MLTLARDLIIDPILKGQSRIGSSPSTVILDTNQIHDNLARTIIAQCDTAIEVLRNANFTKRNEKITQASQDKILEEASNEEIRVGFWDPNETILGPHNIVIDWEELNYRLTEFKNISGEENTSVHQALEIILPEIRRARPTRQNVSSSQLVHKGIETEPRKTPSKKNSELSENNKEDHAEILIDLEKSNSEINTLIMDQITDLKKKNDKLMRSYQTEIACGSK